METLGLLARRPKQAASPDHFPSTTAENTPPHPKYSSFTASAKQRAQNNLHSKYSSPPQPINIAQNILLQLGHAILKAWFLLETTARASSPPWPSTKAHIFLEHKILFFFLKIFFFTLNIHQSTKYSSPNILYSKYFSAKHESTRFSSQRISFIQHIRFFLSQAQHRILYIFKIFFFTLVK